MRPGLCSISSSTHSPVLVYGRNVIGTNTPTAHCQPVRLALGSVLSVNKLIIGAIKSGGPSLFSPFSFPSLLPFPSPFPLPPSLLFGPCRTFLGSIPCFPDAADSLTKFLKEFRTPSVIHYMDTSPNPKHDPWLLFRFYDRLINPGALSGHCEGGRVSRC